jgi:hypothetical protein
MNPSPSPVGELVASGCSAAWGSPTSLAAETWIALGVPVVLSSAWGGGKLRGTDPQKQRQRKLLLGIASLTVGRTKTDLA